MAQAWGIVAQALSPLVLQSLEEWAASPCGGELLNRLLSVYHERQDTQSVASLAALIAAARCGADGYGPRVGAKLLKPEVQRLALAHMACYADVLRAYGCMMQAAEMTKALSALSSSTATLLSTSVAGTASDTDIALDHGSRKGLTLDGSEDAVKTRDLAARRSAIQGPTVFASSGTKHLGTDSTGSMVSQAAPPLFAYKRQASIETGIDGLPDPRAVTTRVQCDVRMGENFNMDGELKP